MYQEVVMRFASVVAGAVFSSLVWATEGSHYEYRYVKEFPTEGKVLLSSASGGEIKGKVIYTGKKELKNKRKLITKDKEVCGRGYKIDEVYVVSKSGGVKNAVVFLENVKGVKREKGAKVVQKKCEFKPRVVAMTVGSYLEVINEDSVKHEANGVQDFETIFQLSQPSAGMKDKVKLDKPGVVEITCNIHGWMKGWAVVLNNDFYSVTDSEGNFSIGNVPPGEYRLKVWHEGFGEKSVKVKVSEGKATNVSFEFR